jgi:hypothetical protein
LDSRNLGVLRTHDSQLYSLRLASFPLGRSMLVPQPLARQKSTLRS